MGAEYGHRAVWNFVQFLDEACALVLQRVDDMLVVDDLVADVDGLAELLQRALDDVDGANDAGAKSTGLGENDSHRDSCLLGRSARTGGYNQHLGAVQPAQDCNTATSFYPVWAVGQGLE